MDLERKGIWEFLIILKLYCKLNLFLKKDIGFFLERLKFIIVIY